MFGRFSGLIGNHVLKGGNGVDFAGWYIDDLLVTEP